MQQTSLAHAHHDPVCLIVEDSHFDYRRMSRVIHHSGIKMDMKLAPTLGAARAALAHHHVSMILLDNNLPDGTGVDFALELANNPQFGHIPIVMVSDWPTPFMWDKAEKAGVMYVVNKSEFNVTFFKLAVRRSFQNRHLKIG